MKTIYCIPKLDQIDKFMDYSHKYNAGFEYNDFFIPDILDNKDKTNEIINSYLTLGRDTSEDTMHGVFLDICVHSSDSLIYKASDYRIHQSMEIAKRLGVKAVIFHTNQIPNFRLKSYLDGWVYLNEKYWRNIIKEYSDINIYIENMFDEDPYLLAELAKRMKDEPGFGVCFDLAHAFISSTPLDEWCNTIGGYARHLHINDNNKLEDTHHPVGSMQLPWDIYNEYIKSLEEAKRPTVLIEVRGYENLRKSTEFMTSHNMYPFNLG